MKILVIYFQKSIPLRNTIKMYLECFEKYSNHDVFYYNSRFKFSNYLKKKKWDLIIFHTTFLITRSYKDLFDKLIENINFLKKYECLKVALPQDEAAGGKYLCEFFGDFEVKIIFTEIFLDSDIKIIYKTLKNKNKVKIVKVLSGYVDSSEIKHYEKYSKTKTIDFSYRVFSAKARNGYLGYQKILIGNLFKEKLAKSKFSFDISMNVKKTIYGLKWIKFMANSKYTLGIEGGSSLYDPEYKFKDKCLEYEKKNPNASFREIEAECFKNKDNLVSCAVITPRMFEAAMAKTCLILKEGSFSGILKKNVHYIPIKKDYSNIDNIIKNLNDKEREKITERCHRDLIKSGNYTYEKFVKNFFKEISPNHLQTKSVTSNYQKFLNYFFKELYQFYCSYFAKYKVNFMPYYYILKFKIKFFVYNLFYKIKYCIFKKKDKA